MANIRGNSFVAIKQWLEQNLDDERYHELIAGMRPSVGRSLDQAEGWTWYPLEYLTEIFEYLIDELGNGKPASLVTLGEFIAENDLGGGPKTKTALLPMPRVIARLPGLWARTKDCGELLIESNDANHRKSVVKLVGYEGNAMHCTANMAWLDKVCKLLSGTEVKVKSTSCRWVAGGSSCTWEITWK